MSNDEAWMEDVHRWYYGGTAPEAYRDDSCAEEVIGYEAAHPRCKHNTGPMPRGHRPRPGRRNDVAGTCVVSFTTGGALPPSRC